MNNMGAETQGLVSIDMYVLPATDLDGQLAIEMHEYFANADSVQ